MKPTKPPCAVDSLFPKKLKAERRELTAEGMAALAYFPLGSHPFCLSSANICLGVGKNTRLPSNSVGELESERLLLIFRSLFNFICNSARVIMFSLLEYVQKCKRKSKV